MSSKRTKIKAKACEDRISALPNDLLVRILSHIPTRDAVSTMVLSKRWRFVWTMLLKLDFKPRKKRVGDFVDKTLQLHRAPILRSLSMTLCQRRAIDDADVGKWVTDAVKRCVQDLKLDLVSLSGYQILPACLYTCKTLVKLILSRKVVVYLPFTVCLPSLQSLELSSVDYMDQDSQLKLLSSCPVLKDLLVIRNIDDNLTEFIVKVPSLESLRYMHMSCFWESLFVDSPRLHNVKIYVYGFRWDSLSIENMPRLDVAVVKFDATDESENEKIMTSFSSVRFLNLNIYMLRYWSLVNFSRLIELNLCGEHLSVDGYWFEHFMPLLHNTPKLKVLMIYPHYYSLPASWEIPSSVPECLLSSLEIFQWREYYGFEHEKQLVSYILANSMCLKTAGISLSSSHSKTMTRRKKIPMIEQSIQELKEELGFMHRVSASSQLLFSAELKWRH